MEITWIVFILLIVLIVPVFVWDYKQAPKLIYAKELNWSVIKRPLIIMVLSLLPSGILIAATLSQIGFDYFNLYSLVLFTPLGAVSWVAIIATGGMVKVYWRYLAEQEKRKNTKSSAQPDHG